MSDLVALANAKLRLAAEERARALPTQIEAIKREHAAKGLAHSGATLKRVRAVCIVHVKEHGAAVATEYKWAVTQALLATQTWAEQLALAVPAQFQYLAEEINKRLVEVSGFTRTPGLANRLIGEVRTELDVAIERAQLETRAAFAEKSRGLARSIPGAIANAISRISRGGA